MKYLRKIIRVTAEDSPNVKLALMEQARGLKPSGRQILRGVLSWEEYQRRRATWHPMRQCVGLDAQFWEGKELLLYPPEWLNMAEKRAGFLRTSLVAPRLTGAAIGIDTAEGGDNTAMCVTDKLGVLELISEKTTDTSVIPGKVIALGRKWQIPSEKWIFDMGGGGNIHANHLRAQGYNPRTIGFGQPVNSGMRKKKQRRAVPTVDKVTEERYVYMDVRAEMYHRIRLLLDPSENPEGFGIPPEYHELRFQMTPIPMLYDGQGRIFLPPKHRRGRTGVENPGRTYEKTLVELIGHSPDELDALALAVHGMHTARQVIVVGAAW